MFIDLNCFLRWAMWPMGLLFCFCFVVVYFSVYSNLCNQIFYSLGFLQDFQSPQCRTFIFLRIRMFVWNWPGVFKKVYEFTNFCTTLNVRLSKLTKIWRIRFIPKHNLVFLIIKSHLVNKDQIWIFKAKIKAMKANQIISDILSMLEQINWALCTNNTMHITVIEKIRVWLDLFALKWRDEFSVL